MYLSLLFRRALFNELSYYSKGIKNNIMKTVLYLISACLFTLSIGCGSSKFGINRDTEAIIGLWEVKAIHNSDESGYKIIPPGMFKMVQSDGRFTNFMSTDDGAIITVDGSYTLKDNLYTESIINSFNKSQEGKDNPLQIKMPHSNFMYLRWFQPIDELGVIQNRWVEEIWQRVVIEDLEVSNVDLRQELRQLLDDEELIKKVIQK